MVAFLSTSPDPPPPVDPLLPQAAIATSATADVAASSIVVRVFFRAIRHPFVHRNAGHTEDRRGSNLSPCLAQDLTAIPRPRLLTIRQRNASGLTRLEQRMELPRHGSRPPPRTRRRTARPRGRRFG